MVLTGQDRSTCRGCGRCCWDWKGSGDPATRCEHLADDLRTCRIYERLEELKPECRTFPTTLQACDLHPECGYMIAWSEAGLI